jgi:hypothetical protein
MKPWGDRPVEAANLLNPTFCCVVLTASIVSYTNRTQTGIPYPLIFLVLPIVLGKTTRDKLPQNIRTPMAAWLQNNADTKLQFADRVIALKPYTQEAVTLGLLFNWLVLEQGGGLQTTRTEQDVNRFAQRLDGEVKDCVRAARFVGRWFASESTPQTIMALWGIRP